MPPIVQLTCVDGFGPTIRPQEASASLALSRAMPGWITAVFASRSTETSR